MVFLLWNLDAFTLLTIRTRRDVRECFVLQPTNQPSTSKGWRPVPGAVCGFNSFFRLKRAKLLTNFFGGYLSHEGAAVGVTFSLCKGLQCCYRLSSEYLDALSFGNLSACVPPLFRWAVPVPVEQSMDVGNSFFLLRITGNFEVEFYNPREQKLGIGAESEHVLHVGAISRMI